MPPLSSTGCPREMAHKELAQALLLRGGHLELWINPEAQVQHPVVKEWDTELWAVCSSAPVCLKHRTRGACGRALQSLCGELLWMRHSWSTCTRPELVLLTRQELCSRCCPCPCRATTWYTSRLLCHSSQGSWCIWYVCNTCIKVKSTQCAWPPSSQASQSNLRPALQPWRQGYHYTYCEHVQALDVRMEEGCCTDEAAVETTRQEEAHRSVRVVHSPGQTL